MMGKLAEIQTRFLRPGTFSRCRAMASRAERVTATRSVMAKSWRRVQRIRNHHVGERLTRSIRGDVRGHASGVLRADAGSGPQEPRGVACQILNHLHTRSQSVDAEALAAAMLLKEFDDFGVRKRLNDDGCVEAIDEEDGSRGGGLAKGVGPIGNHAGIGLRLGRLPSQRAVRAGRYDLEYRDGARFAVFEKSEVVFGESRRGTGFAADYHVDLYQTRA